MIVLATFGEENYGIAVRPNTATAPSDAGIISTANPSSIVSSTVTATGEGSTQLTSIISVTTSETSLDSTDNIRLPFNIQSSLIALLGIQFVLNFKRKSKFG